MPNSDRQLADKLVSTLHTFEIIQDTETAVGYLEEIVKGLEARGVAPRRIAAAFDAASTIMGNECSVPDVIPPIVAYGRPYDEGDII